MGAIDVAHWAWPQWTFLGMMAFSFCRGIFKHGESDGTVNFWVSLIAIVLTGALLICGGFYK